MFDLRKWLPDLRKLLIGSPRRNSALRAGAKRSAKRIIEHRKQWKNTPSNESVSRQVRRRDLRLRLKKEESARRALILLHRKEANGIVGEIRV